MVSNGLKMSSINKKFQKFIKLIKIFDEDIDEGYIFEVDIEYPKCLHDLHSDLPFSPERIKTNKCHKIKCSLYDKKAMLFIQET